MNTGVLDPVTEESIISKFKSKNLSKCEKEWSIELHTTAVKAEEKRFYDSIAPLAEVPGFRKGKAPRAVLEQHFKERAREEITKHLLQQSIREAIGKEKDDLIYFPSIHDVQFDSSTLSYKAHVELRPQIKLGKYRNLKVSYQAPAVTEKDIDELVDRMRDQSATFHVVEDRPVAIGDYILADFVITVDGAEIDKRDNEMFEIAATDYLPGFSKQVEGLRVGETRDVQTEFPKNYPQEKYAGKPCVFRVTLKEIKQKKRPEANDEWAVSTTKLKSYDELRTEIRKDLERSKTEEAEQAFERALLDALIGQAKFDLPEGVIERRVHHLKHQQEHKLKAYGISEDKAKKWAEENAGDLKKEAERQVRVSFIFDEIARVENMTVSPEEVTSRIEEWGISSGQTKEKALAAYQDEDKRDSLREQLKFEKVLTLLKGSAQKA